jgi:hypothetical protein
MSERCFFYVKNEYIDFFKNLLNRFHGKNYNNNLKKRGEKTKFYSLKINIKNSTGNKFLKKVQRVFFIKSLQKKEEKKQRNECTRPKIIIYKFNIIF